MCPSLRKLFGSMIADTGGRPSDDADTSIQARVGSFLDHTRIGDELKFFGQFHVRRSLPKMPAQEFPIRFVEIRDTVENIPPQIEIIALMNDAVVRPEREFGASVQRRGWIFIEHHDHLPLEKDLVDVRGQGDDLHVQLLTTSGEARTHCSEPLDAFNPLNAILKDNILMIVGKDMRPVRLPICIVSTGPEFTKPLFCEGFHHNLIPKLKFNIYDFHFRSQGGIFIRFSLF
jgi:hypothetical protein